MKIILTGTTGFIGTETLQQCLTNPSITSIIALSRRPLPDSLTGGPKLKVVILKDFLSYPDSVLQDIKGAQACIWNLGVTPKNLKNFTQEQNREISIDYNAVAAKTFEQALVSSGNSAGSKFRFVYVSGFMTERDQSKSLWFMGEMRRVRGQSENVLLDYAKEHADTFQAYILRAALVMPQQATWSSTAMSLIFPSVRVDVLASRLVSLALEGSDKRIFENAEIGAPAA